MLSTEATRWLHTSGVVPTRPDGSVPESIGEQAETVWSSIGAMLEDAEMTMADIISVTTYVVVDEDLGEVMAARDRFLAGHLAASTLIIVPCLAQESWRMEIAIVASV